MSNLTITRIPQFLDPWFAEVEQIWDEIEAATNDQETRISTLESAIISDIVTSISKSGDTQLQGDVTLSAAGSITLTQAGNDIQISGGGVTDHGGLTGLLDDDHTQYLLASGVRALAGAMSFGNFQISNFRLQNVSVNPAGGNQGRLIYNTTDSQVKFDNGVSFQNIGVTDHGALSGLGDDDHTQYILVDGTRAFTGNIQSSVHNTLDIGTNLNRFKDIYYAGTLFGGSSPMRLQSSAPDVDLRTTAMATVTVLDNTFEGDEAVQITDNLSNVYYFDIFNTWFPGVDTDDTALQIANAINGIAGMTATNLGSVVTILTPALGEVGNNWLISIVDPVGSDLAVSGTNFTGGSGESAIAYDLTTEVALTVDQAKLLRIKNFNTEIFSIDKSGNLVTFNINAADITASGIVVNSISNDDILLKKTNLSNTSDTFLQLKPYNAGNPGFVLKSEQIGGNTSANINAILDLPNGAGIYQMSTTSALGKQAAMFMQSYDNVNGTYFNLTSIGQFGTNTLLIGDNGGFDGIRLSTPNKVSIQGNSEISGTSYNTTGAFTFESVVTDGVSSVAYTLGTSNSLSTVGSKLLSLKNNTEERFSIDKNGSLVLGNGISGANEVYFRNYAANIIRSEGSLGLVFDNSGPTDTTFTVSNSSGTMFQLSDFDYTTILKSGRADSASNIAFTLSTLNALTVPSTKLLQINNTSNEKFSIGYNGAFNVHRRGTATSANSAGEFILAVTNTSSARTITIDTDDEIEGRILIIKDESGGAGTNNITIDTEGSSLIDGAASVSITANYGVARLYFNGTNWFSF